MTAADAVALQLAREALRHAEQECRYHGTDFLKLGSEPYTGVPRCDSCKQPWRVAKALAAIAVVMPS